MKPQTNTTMQRRRISPALSLILASASWCLFFFALRYHLHYQEQGQLFLFTWGYFTETVLAPGGLADWLGRFLTQFSYWGALGAAVTAAVICGVQLSCRACLVRRDFLPDALSLVPAMLVLAFLCDEDALLTAPLAIIISLLAARVLGKGKRAEILAFVLTPVMYLACDSFAILFTLVFWLRARDGFSKAWAIKFAAALALMVACPLLARFVFPFHADRYLTGIHYYRYVLIKPVLPWIAVLCSALAVLASSFELKPVKTFWSVAVWVAVAVLAIIPAHISMSSSRGELLRYSYDVRQGDWQDILKQAGKKAPKDPMGMASVNLALSMTGRMGTDLFRYPQLGWEGLLPDMRSDHFLPLVPSEAYWQCGMVNDAQRFTFEAQESFPDYQKSAYYYLRLAKTNLANGDDKVAERYLSELDRTLFYRHVREEVTRDAMEKKALRLKHGDAIFLQDEVDSLLRALVRENPKNRVACDYLMSWAMLDKDLERAGRYFEDIGYKEAAPQLYQEAYLLDLARRHAPTSPTPSGVTEENVLRLQDVMNNGKAPNYLRRRYFGSFWYYYFQSP